MLNYMVSWDWLGLNLCHNYVLTLYTPLWCDFVLGVIFYATLVCYYNTLVLQLKDPKILKHL